MTGNQTDRQVYGVQRPLIARHLLQLLLLALSGWYLPASQLDLKVTGEWVPSEPITVNGMAVANGMLYLGHDGGLQILELHDLSAAEVVGSYSSETVWGVAVSGEYAFISTSGLKVLDVSDPRNPVLVGESASGGRASRILVHQSKVYLFTGVERDSASAMEIYDVSNPADPQLVGEWVGSSSDAVVCDGYVFAAASPNGINIIDVHDPSAPALVRFINVPGVFLIRRVALDGRLLYLLDPYNLLAYDISSPENPVPVAAFQSVSERHDEIVALPGGYVVTYEAFENKAIAYALTPSGSFELAGELPLPFRSSHPTGMSLVASGKDAYFANGGGRFAVVDFGRQANPQAVTSYPLEVYNSKFFETSLVGGQLHVNTYQTWSTLDVSNPLRPDQQAFQYVWSNNITTMWTWENGAIGAVEGGLTYLAVPASGPPQPVGAYLFVFYLGSHPALTMDANRAFVAPAMSDIYGPRLPGSFFIEAPGIACVDLRSAAGPEILSVQQGRFFAPVLAGDHLYGLEHGTNGESLMTWSVKDNEFVERSRIRLSESRLGLDSAVVVEGDALFVLLAAPELDGRTTSVQAFSISDREQPVRMANVAMPLRLGRTLVRKGFIYTGNSSHGFDVVDIRDPATPRRVGGNSAMGVYDFSASENAVFVVDRGRLYVLPPYHELPAYQPLLPTLVDDAFRFQVRGIPGTSVQVQRASGLSGWQDWQSLTFEEDNAVVVDSEPQSTGERFYRVVLP